MNDDLDLYQDFLWQAPGLDEYEGDGFDSELSQDFLNSLVRISKAVLQGRGDKDFGSGTKVILIHDLEKKGQMVSDFIRVPHPASGIMELGALHHALVPEFVAQAVEAKFYKVFSIFDDLCRFDFLFHIHTRGCPVFSIPGWSGFLLPEKDLGPERARYTSKAAALRGRIVF